MSLAWLGVDTGEGDDSGVGVSTGGGAPPGGVVVTDLLEGVDSGELSACGCCPGRVQLAIARDTAAAKTSTP
jgi:hypothetical protein